MTIGLMTCRSCGSTSTIPVLSLGKMPLANAFLKAEELSKPEPAYPLDLVVCTNCWLVQITETIPPELLFRNYLYFSSFSDTVLKNSQELADSLIADRQLSEKSLVVEVASNDGYLLHFYRRRGIPVLGIEPAQNVARVAREKGIRTISEFFDEALATSLRDRGERADVIHAHNVLAHVANLNGFVRGLRQLVKDDGVVIIEVPYVRDLVDRCEFDTIYHEHLCYFSLLSISSLLARHGLVIAQAQKLPIHGGSLRIFAIPDSAVTQVKLVGSEPQEILAEEERHGMKTQGYYHGFAGHTNVKAIAIRTLLSSLKNEQKRIAAYGAAAKGTVMLNYLGLDGETLDFIVDRNSHKQGLYMPGVHIPIVSPTQLIEKMPDYVVLLSWNFADEILDQQKQFRGRGGKFVIPMPELAIV